MVDTLRTTSGISFWLHMCHCLFLHTVGVEKISCPYGTANEMILEGCIPVAISDHSWTVHSQCEPNKQYTVSLSQERCTCKLQCSCVALVYICIHAHVLMLQYTVLFASICILYIRQETLASRSLPVVKQHQVKLHQFPISNVNCNWTSVKEQWTEFMTRNTLVKFLKCQALNWIIWSKRHSKTFQNFTHL